MRQFLATCHERQRFSHKPKGIIQVNNHLRRFVAFASCIFAFGLAHAADQATFDVATNRLTLSRVAISDTVAFTNVVLQITGFGTVAVNDANVGSSISFDAATFALRLPTVTIGSQTFSKVSLTGLTFSLVSFGAQVDAGTSSNYNLDLVITASGIVTPAIRITNVPKPSGQSDFCAESNYQTFQQNVQGFSGSWSITSCSFNGTTGTIAAQLTITSPITMSLPYSVTYTYSAP